MKQIYKLPCKSQKAANMVEYALLVATIAIVCIGSLRALGISVRDKGFKPIIIALSSDSETGGTGTTDGGEGEGGTPD